MKGEEHLEELADNAVDRLRDHIDTEQQEIKEKHELHEKLLAWDHIFTHNCAKIPPELNHLHELNDHIHTKIEQIRQLIESDMMRDLTFLTEEENIMATLNEDIKHRDWRACRKDIDLETQKVKEDVNLEKEELKELHTKFIDLMKLMEHSVLLNAIKQDLSILKQKHEYEKLEEYYFLQVYKFANAYEAIFRHLWKKKMHLSDESLESH